MKRRLLALSTAALMALPGFCRAVVPVEQIEPGVISGNDPNYNFSQYAAVEFGGSPTVVGTGSFTGITFHAVDVTNDTSTLTGGATNFHATFVANQMYANGLVSSPYVSDVYNAEAIDFLANSVDRYNTTGGTIFSTGVNLLPSHFPTGVMVVNNSWVNTWAGPDVPSSVSASQDLDTLRRYDFMVNRDDVISVCGAVYQALDTDNNTYYPTPQLWDSYNSLAVAGDNFAANTEPLKQHADLQMAGEPSLNTATVSNYATALLGNAQAAGQTDALHSYLMRSILLAGTTKSFYLYPGGGSLGAISANYGAGQPSFDNSLAILQGGEKVLTSISAGALTATPATMQDGWATGTILANGSSAVVIQSINALTGITASLNWNVTSQSDATNINTTNGAVIFPNLSFEIRPVTFSAGKYVLGAAESNQVFHSNVAGDNTQYIYSTTGLPAGSYALLVTGDPSLNTTVGLSYILAGSFASQWISSTGGSWGSASSWSNGIPNAQAAQAIFPSIASPVTINLDGDRTVGQLIFNSSTGYTISQGTVPTGLNGALTIDDTGDSSGSLNPMIAVLRGSQTINVAITQATGQTINVSTGSALTINGVITSTNGGINKTGGGTLTLTANDNFGYAFIYGGTLSVGPAGSLNNGSAYVYTGGILNLAASASTGILQRNLAYGISIFAGGSVTVAPAVSFANRQLIIASNGLTLSGSLNNWTSKLDLTNNDLDIPNGDLASLTNQLKQGYNSGPWNGPAGILSSTAGADPSHLTTLGIMLNTRNGSTPIDTTFDGYAPAATDVLIKYTYYGDANLDGKVDGSDYTLIDNGNLLHLTGWSNGDFNYDGIINGSDYTLIDNVFNTQGAQISAQRAEATDQIAGPTTVVPEPTGVAMLLPAIGMLLRRRKRSSSVKSFDPDLGRIGWLYDMII